MSAVIPLLAMWLLSKTSTASASAPTIVTTPPYWPSPASPPPPMPAFETVSPPVPATTVEPTANTGTPLAALNQAAKRAPPKPKPSIQKRVTNAAKSAAKAQAKKGLSALTSSVNLSTAQQHTSSVSVLEVQKILNARGAKLKQDGLYGPKTAAAWQAAAKKKTLPPAISRVGPKIAKVVTKTYDTLKVPAIP